MRPEARMATSSPRLLRFVDWIASRRCGDTIPASWRCWAVRRSRRPSGSNQKKGNYMKAQRKPLGTILLAGAFLAASLAGIVTFLGGPGRGPPTPLLSWRCSLWCGAAHALSLPRSRGAVLASQVSPLLRPLDCCCSRRGTLSPGPRSSSLRSWYSFLSLSSATDICAG